MKNGKFSNAHSMQTGETTWSQTMSLDFFQSYQDRVATFSIW